MSRSVGLSNLRSSQTNFVWIVPKSTLFRPEAEKIQRCRLGFFYLRDRKEFMGHDQVVCDHDPFRKVYIYGDEETAAKDMAFIFFQVWNFPVAPASSSPPAFSGKKD